MIRKIAFASFSTISARRGATAMCKPMQRQIFAVTTPRMLCTKTEVPKSDAEVETEVPVDAEAPEVPAEKTLEEINTDLVAQVKNMKDKVLRAYAEEENVRRIAKKDVENARTYANVKFAKSLLDVADNLERALEAASREEDTKDNKAFNNLITGVNMTFTGLKRVFVSHGIEKVNLHAISHSFYICLTFLILFFPFLLHLNSLAKSEMNLIPNYTMLSFASPTRRRP
jgi:molecular chaperone GrpE (heat shock protein)